MKVHPRLMSLLLACGSWLAAPPAHAVISCTVSSPGFTSIYDTATGTPNDNVGSATISCTRASGDSNSVTYTLDSNQGLRSRSQSYRASLNGVDLNYDVYKDAARSSPWAAGAPFPVPFPGTINFGAGTSFTPSLPYYTRIPALQAVAAGIYTDTVTMTLTYGSATAQSTFPVQIYVNTSCQINSPTDLTFNYSSFRVTALTANSTFNVNCTNALPYTLSLDLTSVTDAAINLAYTLALSATSGTGTGANQAVTVTGTMVAGQSGTCATAVCTNAASANKQRTVTVTF